MQLDQGIQKGDGSQTFSVTQGTSPWVISGTVTLGGAGGIAISSVPPPLSTTGGGTEAAALRVTVASDSTGVLSVDDNGGSLTVDGTVTATIAAGASTIAKAEDSASLSSDVGVPAMAIRKGIPNNTSDADGDYEMLQISAGRLWTSTVVDSALPTGTNAIGKLASNSGVDIGDVTLNNNFADETNSVAWMVKRFPHTTTGKPTNRTSSALENSGIIKAAAGTFFGCYGRLDSTVASGTYYFQMLNHSSIPANGNVNLLCQPIKIVHTAGTDDYFGYNFNNGEVTASTGIVFCLSTTEYEKTLYGGSNIGLTIFYT